MRYLRWLILGAFLLAAMVLLAFGPRPAPWRPKDRVIVRYWEKWTGREGEQMQEIVNDFNATVGKEKGIYVEFLSMSNVDRKTLIATSAGVPPDVAGVWDGQMAKWASIGALEPLDDLAAARGIGPAYYKHVYWEGCRYEGKLYGLISTPSSIALLYNKEMFAAKADKLRAAGCDPTRAPATLDELDRYAAALTERDARGNLLVAGYIPAEPGWFKVHTPMWFGGQVYDEATGHFTLTSPECVKAYEWWQSYSRKLGKDAVRDFRAGFGNFSSAQNAWLAGKVAMVQQGPWMGNYIQMNKPEWNNPAVAGMDPNSDEFKASMKAFYALDADQRRELAGWGVAPFPSVYSDQLHGGDVVDKAVAFCGFDVLAIPRGAAHVKEAFEFIAYVNRQDVMEKLCAMHCKNTPLAQTSKDWVRTHPNPYIDLFDRLASSPRAHAMPNVAVWPEVSADMGAMIDRITMMTQSPADALAQVQARAEGKLALWRQRSAMRGRSQGHDGPDKGEQ